MYLQHCSESGHMCAIKEVKVISDDSNSKESLKQLSQVCSFIHRHGFTASCELLLISRGYTCFLMHNEYFILVNY